MTAWDYRVGVPGKVMGLSVRSLLSPQPLAPALDSRVAPGAGDLSPLPVRTSASVAQPGVSPAQTHSFSPPPGSEPASRKEGRLPPGLRIAVASSTQRCVWVVTSPGPWSETTGPCCRVCSGPSLPRHMLLNSPVTLLENVCI